MIKSGLAHAFVAALVAVVLLLGPRMQAETVSIEAVADTSLHETYPENNFGAFSFVHAGSTRTTRTRGLYKFDLTGQIPDGARVTAVSLTLTVVFAAPAPVTEEIEFVLHRMLADWGEGDKDSSGGLSGGTATDGEASWIYSRRPVSWTSPGGEPGMDYVTDPSAGTRITTPGVYNFSSTPELIEDARHWLANPSENFGWMLKTSQEEVAQSAKRFGSRSSEAGAVLTVEYTSATSDLVFTSISVADGVARLEWEGGGAPYQLQTKASLTESWSDIGAATPDRFAEIPANGSQAILRLRSGQ